VNVRLNGQRASEPTFPRQLERGSDLGRVGQEAGAAASPLRRGGLPCSPRWIRRSEDRAPSQASYEATPGASSRQEPSSNRRHPCQAGGPTSKSPTALSERFRDDPRLEGDPGNKTIPSAALPTPHQIPDPALTQEKLERGPSPASNTMGLFALGEDELTCHTRSNPDVAGPGGPTVGEAKFCNTFRIGGPAPASSSIRTDLTQRPCTAHDCWAAAPRLEVTRPGSANATHPRPVVRGPAPTRRWAHRPTGPVFSRSPSAPSRYFCWGPTPT